MHIIAYIDMLGTKAKIKSKDSTSAFSSIKLIYEQMSNLFTTGSFAPENIKVKVFSDNIIIAKATYPSDEVVAVNLNQMIALAASFQFRSMISGWPVRGGVAIGDLYIDNTFVWGEGLLRAYELESKIAVMPRIVIDPIIENKYLNQFNNIHCWRKDAGLPIVDYLSMCQDENTMESIRNPIISMLGSSNEVTIGKIEWLKSDYNRICKERNYTNLII